MDGYQFGALLEGALRRYLGPHDLEVRRGGEGQYEFWFYDVVANGRGIIQAIGTQHMGMRMEKMIAGTPMKCVSRFQRLRW